MHFFLNWRSIFLRRQKFDIPLNWNFSGPLLFLGVLRIEMTCIHIYIFSFGEYNFKQVNVSGIQIFRAQLLALNLRRVMLNAANIYLFGFIHTKCKYIYRSIISLFFILHRTIFNYSLLKKFWWRIIYENFRQSIILLYYNMEYNLYK